MKIIACFATLLFLNQLFTQNEKFTKTLELGISLSPDYANRYMTNKYGDTSLDNVIEQYNKIDRAKFGYTTGINAVGYFSKNFGLQFGVLYANRGFATKIENIAFESTSIPNTLDTSIAKFKSTTSFHTIDLPIQVLYKSGKKKINFIASAGLSANFILIGSQKSKVYYSNEEKPNVHKGKMNNDNLNPIFVSAIVSTGVLYNVSEKFNLRCEPTARLGLTEITKGAPLSTKLYSYGVNFSCFYKL